MCFNTSTKNGTEMGGIPGGDDQCPGREIMKIDTMCCPDTVFEAMGRGIWDGRFLVFRLLRWICSSFGTHHFVPLQPLHLEKLKVYGVAPMLAVRRLPRPFVQTVIPGPQVAEPTSRVVCTNYCLRTGVVSTDNYKVACSQPQNACTCCACVGRNLVLRAAAVYHIRP